MKELVIASLLNAIESKSQITLDVEVNDQSAIHTSFIPDAAEEIDDSVIIYKGTDVYSICGEVVSSENGVYVISNTYSTIILTL